MKVGWQDLGQLNSNSADDITRAVVVPAKEALRQLRQVVGGNLTIRDNQYAAIVTFGAGTQSLTSGTEYTFQNPLRTKPIGFSPIVASNTSGTAVVLSGWQLNTTRTDGLLGITLIQDINGAIGSAGEQVRSFTTSTANTSGSVVNVVSKFTGAGTWDFTGINDFFGSPTSWTAGLITISLTSATENASDGDSRAWYPTGPSAVSDATNCVPAYRITLASSTTVYLTSRCFFATGAVASKGRLTGVRAFRYDSNQLIVTGILWGG